VPRRHHCRLLLFVSPVVSDRLATPVVVRCCLRVTPRLPLSVIGRLSLPIFLCCRSRLLSARHSCNHSLVSIWCACCLQVTLRLPCTWLAVVVFSAVMLPTAVGAALAIKLFSLIAMLPTGNAVLAIACRFRSKALSIRFVAPVVSGMRPRCDLLHRLSPVVV
jgi:hypothetical protein